MPSLNYMTCEVLLPGDVPLQEFGTEYENRAVTSYVPIPEYTVPFTIRLTSEVPMYSHGYAAMVLMDGIYQCMKTQFAKIRPMGSELAHGAYARSSVGKANLVNIRFDGSEQILRPGRRETEIAKRTWTFKKFNIINAEKPVLLSTDIMKALGSIEIVIMRCKEKINFYALPRLYGPGRHGESKIVGQIKEAAEDLEEMAGYQDLAREAKRGRVRRIPQWDGAHRDDLYTDSDSSSNEYERRNHKHCKKRKKRKGSNRHGEPETPTYHPPPIPEAMPLHQGSNWQPYDLHYTMPPGQPGPIHPPYPYPPSYIPYSVPPPVSYGAIYPPAPPPAPPKPTNTAKPAAKVDSDAESDMVGMFKTFAVAEVRKIKQQLEEEKERERRAKKDKEKKEKVEMFAKGLEMLRQAADRKLAKKLDKDEKKLKKDKKESKESNEVFKDKKKLLTFIEDLLGSDDNKDGSDDDKKSQNSSTASNAKSDRSKKSMNAAAFADLYNNPYATMGINNLNTNNNDDIASLKTNDGYDNDNSGGDNSNKGGNNDADDWMKNQTNNDDDEKSINSSSDAQSNKFMKSSRAGNKAGCRDAGKKSTATPKHPYYSSHWEPDQWYSGIDGIPGAFPEEKSRALPETPVYKVPKGKVAKSVVHQVCAGPGEITTRKNVDIEYIDSVQNPYMVFRFKYRQPAVLKKKYNFKVKDMSEEDESTMLKALSKEQLVEMLRSNQPMKSKKEDDANDAADGKENAGAGDWGGEPNAADDSNKKPDGDWSGAGNDSKNEPDTGN